MSSASSLNTLQMEKAVQHSCSKGRFQPKDSILNRNNPIQIPCEKWTHFIKSTKKNKWHAKSSVPAHVKHLHQRPRDHPITVQYMWMQLSASRNRIVGSKLETERCQLNFQCIGRTLTRLLESKPSIMVVSIQIITPDRIFFQCFLLSHCLLLITANILHYLSTLMPSASLQRKSKSGIAKPKICCAGVRNLGQHIWLQPCCCHSSILSPLQI